MIQVLLAILLALPVYHLDKEAPSERSARMLVVAQSIDAAVSKATCDGPFADDACKPVWAGSREELGALLVTVAWHETALAQHVHAGRCERWECDHFAARSIFQLHVNPWVSHATWDQLEGTGYVPTVTSAYAAARILGAGLKRCRSPEASMGFFANGNCRWGGVGKRAPLYRRTLAALRASNEVEKTEVPPATKPQD